MVFRFKGVVSGFFAVFVSCLCLIPDFHQGWQDDAWGVTMAKMWG